MSRAGLGPAAALAVLGVALAASLAACAVDANANPARHCTIDSDCGDGGGICHRGLCTSPGITSGCPTEGATEPCYGGMTGCTANASGAFDCVGACAAGQRMCLGGVWSACLGAHTPAAAETCNGMDDDCDGMTDEGLDGVDCDTHVPGACARGRTSCAMGHMSCVPTATPVAETCNGTDDDCDGMTDEGTDVACYPSMPGCTMGSDGSYTCVGVCAAGTQHCTPSGGTAMLGACMGATTPAMDDNCTPPGMTPVDDDCDGMTDEDCMCMTGATQTCYTGPTGTAGVGICHTGMQTCGGTPPRFGACMGSVGPGTETCANDGADDDCDGVMDDVPMRGDACTVTGMRGLCANGVQTCTSSGLSCVGPSATTETCNGLDDDCNGTIDDGFDLNTDANNCGMCGRVCGTGLSCCGGACVDTHTTATDCGTCGHSCGAGACCGGACVDTGSDGMNCGMCGQACAAGRTCCGGSCVDTTSDHDHCGSCGATPCSGTQMCCAGSCQSPTAPACTGCTADCASMGRTCCVPSCIDTMNDPAHCGGCGAPACASGQLCCGGSCVNNDAAHCGACGTSCGAGTLCCSSGCVPDNAANCHMCGHACTGGQACCASGCSNGMTDPANCGGCGIACGGSQTCMMGHCCTPPQVGCASGCADLMTDDNNCGMCGHACGFLAPHCRSGGCSTL